MYKNAVPQLINQQQLQFGKNRESSSSEEGLDTSDESNKPNLDGEQLASNQDIDCFISDVRCLSAGQQQLPVKEVAQPHCSRDPDPQPVPAQLMRAEVMVRDAEAAKARILEVPGMFPAVNNNNEVNVHNSLGGNVAAFVLVDEEYLVVGNYVDDLTKRKIGNGEYVDFSKLLPKDKVGMEEDHHMEMINKGGMFYWVPVSDHENAAISNFNKWEQVFRVYMNIYTYFHPSRAGEMIQYNHIIHTAAQSFSWENVYYYDREFRIHMSRHHLNRSWAVILQQTWSMCLKDKVNHSSLGFHAGGGGLHKKETITMRVVADSTIAYVPISIEAIVHMEKM